MFFQNSFRQKTQMPTSHNALPGRDDPIKTAKTHFVNNLPLKGPWPDYMETAYFAMGCFWGVERLFWQIDGVYLTACGYAGGLTPNPSYEETLIGKTGHTEIVQLVFDPEKVSYDMLLKVFWQNHDPTQGMRQGNDIGTSYRSAIYTSHDQHLVLAQKSRENYQINLEKAGIKHDITTEIKPLDIFYYAEDYHQQYLAKNPDGYCALKGIGIQA